MRARASRRGVTLIELMVAVSLLSLLSVGMLMSLHVGLNAMEKSSTKLIANRRAASVQRILESEIAGLMPANADCANAVSGMPSMRALFFDGRPASMRFVSTYSLDEAFRGAPRILELQVIPGAEGRGVRLVVNELPYGGPRSTGAFCLGFEPGRPVPRYRDVEVGANSFVLADKLAYCRFQYREALPAPALERWTPEWAVAKWPSAVRVEMAQLEPDPSRVPLVGLTVALPMNRTANAPYLDGN